MRDPISAMREIYHVIMNYVRDDAQVTIEITGKALGSLDEVVDKLGSPSRIEIVRRAIILYHSVSDDYIPGENVRVQIGTKLLNVTDLFSGFDSENQGPPPRHPQNPKPREPTGRIVNFEEYKKQR